MSRTIFVTGIGTDVGKTVVSAILTEALKADYWKPIQSGDLDNSDTLKVKRLISNVATHFHPEAYRLTEPFSPHKSAHLDGIRIELAEIKMPETKNTLLIEGAGGLMVPLNDEHLIIDLIAELATDVVLVTRNYLGSINHTLLSIAALQSRGINIKAIVFSGQADEYTESSIRQYTRGSIPFYHIPELPVIDKEIVAHQAEKMLLAGIKDIIN